MTLGHQTTSNLVKFTYCLFAIGHDDRTSDEINEKAYHFRAKVFHL